MVWDDDRPWGYLPNLQFKDVEEWIKTQRPSENIEYAKPHNAKTQENIERENEALARAYWSRAASTKPGIQIEGSKEILADLDKWIKQLDEEDKQQILADFGKRKKK